MEKNKKFGNEKNENIFYLIFIYNKNKFNYDYFFFKGNPNLKKNDIYEEIFIWVKLKIDKNIEYSYFYDIEGKNIISENFEKKKNLEKLKNFFFCNLKFSDFLKKEEELKIYIFSNLKEKNIFINIKENIILQKIFSKIKILKKKEKKFSKKKKKKKKNNIKKKNL